MIENKTLRGIGRAINWPAWPGQSWWRKGTVVAGWVYLAALVGWLVLGAIFGDRWWWLFLLNAGAVYLFLPLPVLVVAALVRRRPAQGWQAGVVLVIWGGLFLPGYLSWPGLSAPTGPTLVAASYNLLGFNDRPDRVVATIETLGADVLALQELSPSLAAAIERDLADQYPYQMLDPQIGVTGAGIISRYPLLDTGQTLPGGWIGRPQIGLLDFHGQPVTILNFHAYPFTIVPPGIKSGGDSIEWTVRERERQVQAVLDFVAAHPGPLLAMTDLNADPRSRAYRQLTGVLQDGWGQAGQGPGHTFPGRSSLGNIALPDWLIRIDYVFHSRDWQATSALVGPWDGVSDHRPVLVSLALVSR